MKDLELPEDSRGSFARTIENILTPAECKALIGSTEKMGYEQALVNIGQGQ